MNEEQFESHVDMIPIAGCWIWRAGFTSNGYGEMSVRRYPKLTHKFSYELYKGSIPSGSCVLHKCDVKCCVNPEHLYVGTMMDNGKDAVDRGQNFYSSQTHCKRGHEFTIENTYRNNGGRGCRA